MDATETLQKQRRNALGLEILCFGLAVLVPAVGALLLGDKLAAMWQVPLAIWVPLIPPFVLFLGGIGFHRHRKGLEQRIRAAAEARAPAPRR